MTRSTLYTPLESLLLFQSLAAHGVEHSSFTKISATLAEHPLIRGHLNGDLSRLAPEALKNLYLGLLKEEIKSPSTQQENDGQINPRKRKIPSPPLATVQEATRHAHLLPQLIARLYSRYQSTIIEEIRGDEQRYRKLHGEVEALSKAVSDGRSEIESKPVEPDTRPLSSVQGLLSNESGLERRPTEVRNIEATGPSVTPTEQGSKAVRPLVVGTPLPEQTLKPGGSKDPTTTGHETLSDVQGEIRSPKPNLSNLATPGTKARDDISSQATSNLVRPTSTELRPSNYPPLYPNAPSPTQPIQQAPSSSPHQNDPTARLPSLPPLSNAASPRLPPPQSLTHGYRLASPLSHPPPRQPPPPNYSPGFAGELPGSRTPQFITNTINRSPSIPGALPGPTALQSPSSGPIPALPDAAGQQYRGHTLPSPLQQSRPLSAQNFSSYGPNNALSNSNPQLPQPPQPGTQLPQKYFQNSYTYGTRQPSYPSQAQQLQQPMAPYYPHGQGGVILPPFQSTPPYPHQDTTKQYPQYFQHQQTPLPAHMRSQPNPASVPNLRSLQSTVAPPKSTPNTPITTAASNRIGSQLPRLDTSTSSTRWKPAEKGSAPQSPGSPSPPWDAFSPISDRESSPKISSSEQHTPINQKDESVQQQRTLEMAIKRSDDESKLQMRSRRPRTRGKKGPAPGRSDSKRAESTSSSAVVGTISGRTRSQSIVSHADELSIDNGTGKHIKYEPPSTPAGLPDENEPENADTIADEGKRISTRRRRGTVRGLEQVSIISKRKRSIRETPDASESNVTTSFETPRSFVPSKPSHVMATRNFPRTSQTIMNDITSHKHASTFANPVKERDAPGYKDLVYQPQDLKSIKSAIAAGGRVVTAFAGQVGTPGEIAESPAAGVGTPSAKKDSNIWIPANLDVVPPKGIINSAQLEKELMRMLANAVMFNLDPDRGVGPRFGKADVDEAAKDDEEGTGGPAVEEGGVIKDTREMFESIEEKIAEWRAAERAVEDLGTMQSSKGKAGGKERDEDDVDELAGENGIEEARNTDHEGEDPGMARKRRRL